MPTVECGFTNLPTELVEYGPTLHVQIGLDPGFRPSIHAAPGIPPSQHPALVDTGAALSAIDSGLAMALDLPIISQQPVAGVHGSYEVNMHFAQMYVPALRFTLYGQFAGVHLAAGGQPHRALLGRDFLQHFSLTYDGRTGAVALSTD